MDLREGFPLPLEHVAPLAGKIAAPAPASVTDPVFVTLDSLYQADQPFKHGPLKWHARDASSLPSLGDACVVLELDTGELWVIAWSGSAGGGSGGIQFDTPDNVGDYLEIHATHDYGGGVLNDCKLYMDEAGITLTVDYALDGLFGRYDFNSNVFSVELEQESGSSSMELRSNGFSAQVPATVGLSVLGLHGSYGVMQVGDAAGDDSNGSYIAINWPTPDGIHIKSATGHIFLHLPTADPGVSGALWNNAGAVKVSP